MKKERLNLPELQTEHLFYLEAVCDKEIHIGDTGRGDMNIYPIIGGYFEGDKLRGEICNLGADWNYMQKDGIDIVSTKYLLKTDDGVHIAISTRGVCIETEEQLAMEERGEEVNPADVYFRQHLFFETGSDKYRWLNGVVAFAVMGWKPTGEICYNAYIVK